MDELRILFVDDDPRILSGIRRRVRKLKPSWQIRYAESGEEALGIAAEFLPDGVVSDLRMPGMDGAQLLGEIQHRYPGCFRVALSGHAETDLILQAAEHAHRMQSKPCGVETLVRVVDEGIQLLAKIEDAGLSSWLSGMERLPQPSETVQALISSLRQSGTGIAEIESLLQKDVSLSAHLLHVANGAFFGGGKIDSILEAIQRLGVDVVQGIAMAQLIQRSIALPKSCEPVLHRIYEDCQQVISIALRLNKRYFNSCFKTDVLVTAILIQDIGRLVLLGYRPQRYLDLMRYELKPDSNLPELEKAAFGYSHPEIGARLLNLWGLPESIVTSVALHHESCQPPYADSLACLTFFAGQKMMEERAKPQPFFMKSMDGNELSKAMEQLKSNPT